MHREIAPELDRAWHEIVERSSFVGGERVERFESDWAAFCGVAHAVGVANGTDAIELTLRALGIGPDDEVVVPANTFVATPEAVVLAGATPRFVDVDPGTLQITPETLRGAIGPRTAAVIVVHLFGHMGPMGELLRVAEAHGIALIEDAAQAHGSTWSGKRSGSFGIAGCFSFYPGKNLGAFGDGGAVVTDDGALADRVRDMANHGRVAGSHHLHGVLGRNSRLDALQAAVLSAKLTRLEGWNAARRTAADRYRALLSPHAAPMVEVDPAVSSSYHLNVIRVQGRDAVQAELSQMGVGTGIHYPIPCHQQTPFGAFAPEPLPVVERAAGEILSLPMFPHLTDRQIEYVCASVNVVAEPGGDGDGSG
jgi:dTDP-4-amino-4,6-dideoxygalactose transaminase